MALGRCLTLALTWPSKLNGPTVKAYFVFLTPLHEYVSLIFERSLRRIAPKACDVFCNGPLLLLQSTYPHLFFSTASMSRKCQTWDLWPDPKGPSIQNMK